MTDDRSRKSRMPQFSMGNLLAFTALIAMGMALGLAYYKNRDMTQQRVDLLALSSRLTVENTDELASSELPNVASDFQSWNVHVPGGKGYELRLGIGDLSENGIPPIASAVKITAGKHRVTLYTGDSPRKDFHYVVYVDGKMVIDETLGSDWMPEGWSSASSRNWPRDLAISPGPLQLSSESYQPRRDFGGGPGSYLNGQGDSFVTRKGYRLWIDDADRTYPQAVPILVPNRFQFPREIGLRDGLRFRINPKSTYGWTFARPSLETTDPVMQISAEFFTEDGTLLSRETPLFQLWQLHDDARGENKLNWQADSEKTEYTAFLHAKPKMGESPLVVVEMKWDSTRPDEVALRIADIPANDRIRRWQLRIHDGTKHLWRAMQIGDRKIEANEAFNENVASPSDKMISLDLGKSESVDTRLRWQSNETLPLQIVERQQKSYQSIGLYEGLPVTFGIQIPAVMTPIANVNIVAENPNVPGAAFPGGPVFKEIELDLKAVKGDWIWLQAQPIE